MRNNFITGHLFRLSPKKEHINSNQAYNTDVINNIVKRMETMLQTPESHLCNQDDELNPDNDEIYFIAKGKCDVFVRDKF